MIIQSTATAVRNIPSILKALSSLFSSSVSPESTRIGLQAARNLYFWALAISTMAVAAGVVLEEAESWFRYAKYALPLDPMTEYRWTKKLTKLGWILIVAGVIGEGWFEANLF